MTDNVVVLERATTNVQLRATTFESSDFRVEFNCQQGRHYAKMMRGRGASRKKNSGKEGAYNYEYLGIANVVAQRGGYYAQRWIEYSFNHNCRYS